MRHEILGYCGRLETAFALEGMTLDTARKKFPKAQQPWLDLSTGLNTVAYKVAGIPPESWERPPSETALGRLEDAAARRYGAGAGVSVVAAPGTRSIVQRLPDLCGGSDVRLLGRRSEVFDSVYREAGHEVRVVPGLEALVGADVAIVVNPNNPDGRLVAASELLDLAPRVGVLVVDETFMDALPHGASLVPRLPSKRIIVLRSFGTMHGLAGLRLGFAVLSGDRAVELRRALGAWPVSGPAIAIGTAAFADDTWLDAARTRLASDAARLMFLLRRIGVDLVGGTPLFRLISHPGAPGLFAVLAEAGILTRAFATEPSWLRFSYPADEAGWARLEAAVEAFR